MKNTCVRVCMCICKTELPNLPHGAEDRSASAPAMGASAAVTDGMCATHRLGIQVWPSPGVLALMGTKATLSKVAMLNSGLEDTLQQYRSEEFAAGFQKTGTEARRARHLDHQQATTAPHPM